MNGLVYSHQSPRKFLAEELAARQQAEPSFSIRRWAGEMGISHSLLLMLLQGKRPIKLKHFSAIAQGLRLSSPERLYLQAMIEFDGAESVEQKNLLQLWLSELNPGGPRINVELETFRAISDWIHFALISFCSVAPVPNRPHLIARRFGRRASVTVVRAAIERLLELKLLDLTADGDLVATQNHTTSKNDVADRGVKEYHRQVADLAKSAVLDQSPLEREFQAFSIPMDPAKLQLAKEMIRRFRHQFCEAMETKPLAGEVAASAPAHEVFQMNLHFFRLTESPLETSREEDEGAGPTPELPPENVHVES